MPKLYLRSWHVLLLVCAFAQTGIADDTPRLELRPVGGLGEASDWQHGTLEVLENRQAKRGRKISLYVVVLPATGEHRLPDPVFYLHGGPGAAATTAANRFADSWIRRDRDIVLVDQRGTGRSNPLHVALPGSDDNLQGYLDPIFQVDIFQDARSALEQRADLRQYTTPIAMDDLDDVRAALGYERINLLGGSYGTRAALIYMRRHTNRVRTATLMGVSPVSFLNPLYHARSAQQGLDRIFEEIAAEPAKTEAFPELKKKFQEILERLDKESAQVTIDHPQRATKVTVTLSREAFCEALRTMMYAMPTNRLVPMLLQHAWEGDYAPFVRIGIQSNRRIRDILAMGMLMSVTGSEDIPRIDEAAIVRETEGTFLGDGRVRRQVAVSQIWPRGEVSASYGDPVCVTTPTLVVSGTHDPVTPPRWGEAAARHLPDSLHLVVPAVHGSFGPVVDHIHGEFLKTGTVENLDTSAVKDMRMPKMSVRAEYGSGLYK